MRRLGRKRENRGISLEEPMLEAGPDVASRADMQVLTDTTRGPGTPFPPTLLFVLGLLFAWWLHAAIPVGFVGGAPAGPWLTTLGAIILAVGTGVFWWG